MSRERGRGGYDRDVRYGNNGVSLLVRNLSYRTNAVDLKNSFVKYGDIRDVYIPLDYHSKQPRGFAFIEFYDPGDARAAQRSMDRCIFDGRSIIVVFAQEKRKDPQQMRTRDPERPSPPRGYRRYGRSRSPRRAPPARYRSNSPRYSRSRSPRRRGRGSTGRRESRSRSRTPPKNSGGRKESRSVSRSPRQKSRRASESHSPSRSSRSPSAKDKKEYESDRSHEYEENRQKSSARSDHEEMNVDRSPRDEQGGSDNEDF